MKRTLALIAAVASGALLLAVAAVLSQSAHHRTATSSHSRAVGPPLPPGADMCQQVQNVPAGTGRIIFYAGGAGGPLDVWVAPPGGEPVARGRIPAGAFRPWEGTVARVPKLERTVRDAHVCVRNVGEGTPAVYGQFISSFEHAAIMSDPIPPPPAPIALRIDYEQSEERTWWSFAPEVADRFSLLKAGFLGPWTFWVVMAAMLGLALGTIWYAARAVNR